MPMFRLSTSQSISLVSLRILRFLAALSTFTVSMAVLGLAY